MNYSFAPLSVFSDSWNVLFFPFLLFLVLVIWGGPDATQPLCLLRACSFPSVAGFARVARDVGTFPPRWAGKLLQGEGWTLARQVKLSSEQDGCRKNEFCTMELRKWTRFPGYFFPAFLSCLLQTIVRAVFKMQRHKGSPALAAWPHFKQLHKMKHLQTSGRSS